MEIFSVCLAGVSIEVTAQFAATRSYCQDFLTDAPSEVSIVLTQEDMEIARKAHIETDLCEGRPPGEYSELLEEITALHIRILNALIDHGVVMFHGCAIASEGKAYLFCADSGTGKTTHARLWLKNIPNCHILNGDKPFLLAQDGVVYACGTPWKGKEQYGTDEILPLAGICLLERSAENQIERIRFKEGMSALMHHSFQPVGPAGVLKYMQVMRQLVKIPLYRLGCNMEDEAAFVSYHAMVPKAGKDEET